MEDLKKELEQIATKLDATVEKFQNANAEEVKGLKSEFQNLTKQYNDLSAKLEKDLLTLQGSVDSIKTEEKRLKEGRKAIKTLKSALAEQLSSDDFKNYLKSKKSGDKRAKHNIMIEDVDVMKATVDPSTATTDTSAPDYLPTGIIYDYDRDMFVRNFIPSGSTTSTEQFLTVEDHKKLFTAKEFEDRLPDVFVQKLCNVFVKANTGVDPSKEQPGEAMRGGVASLTASHGSSLPSWSAFGILTRLKIAARIVFCRSGRTI